mgnify:CR=1 FL=1
MMLSKFNDKRMGLWLGVLSLTAVLWSAPAVLPLQSAWAQSSGAGRTLPDFTLVIPGRSRERMGSGDTAKT